MATDAIACLETRHGPLHIYDMVALLAIVEKINMTSVFAAKDDTLRLLLPPLTSPSLEAKEPVASRI